MTLRDELIARLGEERYRLMYLATCDFFGLPLDFDDEFIDRCLADELNLTESECAA